MCCRGYFSDEGNVYRLPAFRAPKPCYNGPMHWFAYPTPPDLPPVQINNRALPLVSIVTPSYNQGRYLAATIESVLGQDYPNIEHWVIDGGSSDETLDVLRRYEHDPRLHWLSERDKGQSDAINKGWSRCRGAIVAWLNSDDTYLPGAIRTQVAALQANPDCGVVYGDSLYIDAEGRELSRLYSPPPSPLALLRLELPHQPTVFLRRSVVQQVGPLNLARRYSMDTDYWLRTTKVTNWCRTQAFIATYRLHGESKSVAQYDGFYRDWLAIANDYFSDPALPAELRNARNGVIADLLAAMANLEARQGSLAAALRYGTLAIARGGLRPRMLKLPISLLSRATGRDLTALATEARSRLRRVYGRN
jgi:glycosyltransferase involved in cell wall biosynthesis